MDIKAILKRYEKKFPGILGAAAGTPGENLAGLRATEQFPAASLIKVPILIYLLKEADSQKINLQETILLKKEDKVGGSGILFELHDGLALSWLDVATLMIVVSDNTATNLLMDRFGIPNIQSWIEGLGLKKTLIARKLMVAPDAPPANFTSPNDMFVLFRKLLGGEILSSDHTKLALEILSRQQYNEKIPLFLPKDTKVAHKTGEIDGVRHDCGIIDPENRKIILCLLTKDLKDELGADRALAELSLEVYRAYE